MAVDVIGPYMKMKCRAVSMESAMVRDGREGRESDWWKGDWEESEGEERGRRQERTNEGEGHKYRFPVGGRSSARVRSSTKFITPELDRGRTSEVSGQGRSS